MFGLALLDTVSDVFDLPLELLIGFALLKVFKGVSMQELRAHVEEAGAAKLRR